MAGYARLPFLVILQQCISEASPLQRPVEAASNLRPRAPTSASSILQDLSKTIVTRTVVTTVTQTQETKTVEYPEGTRMVSDATPRQSTLPVSEGSTPMAEVFAQLRRAAPQEELETIKFPSSPSAYITKDTHGDGVTHEDNLPDQSQPEISPHSPVVGLLDLQEKHYDNEAVKDPEQKHQEALLSKSKVDTPQESKQDHNAEVTEKTDVKNPDIQKTGIMPSFISISGGVGSEFGMLPAACRLLFFLIGFVIVLIAACGCASAALLF